jgi:hypothetical protein
MIATSKHISPIFNWLAIEAQVLKQRGAGKIKIKADRPYVPCAQLI